MNFLSSKLMSFICFCINIVFSIITFNTGDYDITIINIILGAICLSNCFGENNGK